MRILQTLLAVATLWSLPVWGDNTAVIGNWEGKMHGQTGVTLAVRESGGRLEGSVVFYVFRDQGHGPVLVGKEPHELIGAKFADNMLSFQVQTLEGALIQLSMKSTPGTAPICGWSIQHDRPPP